MRQLTLAKNPENESPRASPEPEAVAAEKKRGSGFGLEESGKDEPTYTWRSNYTTGKRIKNTRGGPITLLVRGTKIHAEVQLH